jgi:hypothetical protein
MAGGVVDAGGVDTADPADEQLASFHARLCAQLRASATCEHLTLTPPQVLTYAAALAMGGRGVWAAEALTASLASQLRAGAAAPTAPLAATLAATARLAAVCEAAAAALPALLAGAADAATAAAFDAELPSLLREASAETLLLAATRLAPGDWRLWLAAVEYAGAAGDAGLRAHARAQLREAVAPAGAAPSVADAWTLHATDGWSAAGAPLSGAVDAYHFRRAIDAAAATFAAPGAGLGLATHARGGAASILPLARQARAIAELGTQMADIGDAAEAAVAAAQAEALVADARRGLDAWLLRRQLLARTAQPDAQPTEAATAPAPTSSSAGSAAGLTAVEAAAEETLLAPTAPAFVIEATLDAVHGAVVALRRRLAAANGTPWLQQPGLALAYARARFAAPHLVGVLD